MLEIRSQHTATRLKSSGTGPKKATKLGYLLDIGGVVHKSNLENPIKADSRPYEQSSSRKICNTVDLHAGFCHTVVDSLALKASIKTASAVAFQSGRCNPSSILKEDQCLTGCVDITWKFSHGSLNRWALV